MKPGEPKPISGPDLNACLDKAVANYSLLNLVLGAQYQYVPVHMDNHLCPARRENMVMYTGEMPTSMPFDGGEMTLGYTLADEPIPKIWNLALPFHAQGSAAMVAEATGAKSHKTYDVLDATLLLA